MRNPDHDDPALHRHVSSNHDDRYNVTARACLDSDHNEDTSDDGGSVFPQQRPPSARDPDNDPDAAAQACSTGDPDHDDHDAATGNNVH